MSDNILTISQRTKKAPAATMRELIESKADLFKPVIPANFDMKRWGSVAAQAISQVPTLLECTPTSILQGLFLCAQVGLIPNDHRQQCFLIPYKDRRLGVSKAQVVLGRNGLYKIAKEAGAISHMESTVVYDGDEFIYRRGLHPDLSHAPNTARKPDAKPTHVYCVGWLPDGRTTFEVMAWHEVEKIRDTSQAAYKTIWKDNKPSGKEPDMESPWWKFTTEMARKTCEKKLLKYLRADDGKLASAIALDDGRETGKIIRETDEIDIELEGVVLDDPPESTPESPIIHDKTTKTAHGDAFNEE